LALVFGASGVRSAAALGVAEVLAREGLRPDVIVGSGAGALFGATVAVGMPVEHALRTAAEVWSPTLRRHRHWHAWLQLLAPRLAGIGANVALRDTRAIEQRLRDAFGQRRLEDGPTLLRVAATDAATGEPVHMSRGRVADALRATLAVPLLFAPVAIDGRRLMDGTLSDPLPLAGAADARVVVALGTSDTPQQLDRPSQLLDHVTGVMAGNLMRAQRAAARVAGRRVLHIEPALEREVGPWDTTALRQLYEAGRRAAWAQLPQIASLLEGRALRAAA
jgi:NTE family protein